MPRTISQGELRNDNAEVIRAVVGGETFIVTRNGGSFYKSLWLSKDSRSIW
ncbi:MAG: hypothetical protein NVSMB16_13780 [Acidimicrobiales bacterium]